MVSVPLSALVLFPNSTALWPPEFREFIKSIEREPGEFTAWLACADWVQEKVEELEYAAAFRFAARHAVRLYKSSNKQSHWKSTGLIREISDVLGYEEWWSIAAFVSRLMSVRESARQAAEQKLKELSE